MLLCLETWVCDKEGAGEGARDVGRVEGGAQGAQLSQPSLVLAL